MVVIETRGLNKMGSENTLPVPHYFLNDTKTKM